MSSEKENLPDYKRLRNLLNPAVKGKGVDKVLNSLAPGTQHLIDNVQAVHDSLYIVSAQGRYLEQRFSDFNIAKPANVGLSDEIFRELGLQIKNRKQIRDLIHQLLRVLYGEEFTRAQVNATELEPYSLQHGDTLTIQFDDSEDELEIVFTEDQFQNIGSAEAQEVADAITRNIRRLGRTGAAFARDDGDGPFVVLTSETDGPSSTIRVKGGRAQNELKFPAIRQTSGEPTTQWTLSQEPGGIVRATWSGGPNPSIGRVRRGDYVNIFGTSFDPVNRGTYTITNAQGGLVNSAFVEFENFDGIPEIVTQGTSDAILFFNPRRTTIQSVPRYAAAYQTSPRVLEVYMPVSTRVVRRDRQGAAHIQDGDPSIDGQFGPHIHDLEKPYVISENFTNVVNSLDSSSESIIEVDDSSLFPSERGHLVLGFGTAREEGPIPYISRPSNNTLRIDPSYTIRNRHPSGTDVTLIAQNSPINIAIDGSDFSFYATDTISGRLYAENLIQEVAATGITVLFFILYPDPVGLENWTRTEEEAQTWKRIWDEP